MTFKLTEINGKAILKTLAGYVLNILGIKDLNTATSNVANNRIDWTLQLYTNTAANFTSTNPVLLVGQLGIETDGLATSPKFKIGNGTTAWNSLPYSSATATTWGAITGALSSQTDLQNALDAKADVSDLVSVYATARNNTGSTITKGQVVYLTGAVGQTPTIALAKADAENTSFDLGVATFDIPNNTQVANNVTILGLIDSINTSALTEGAPMYLSATTAGAVTSTAPTSPHFVQPVGFVAYSHINNGKLIIRTEVPLAGNTTLSSSNRISPTSLVVKTNIDLKAPIASPTFTGTVTLPNNTVTNAMLAGSITVSKLTGGVATSTLYGTDYGIVADGVTDNTAAFNTFMAACKAGQYKGELPLGSIVFLSKPNDIDFAWDLGGKGLNGTVLIRKYNEATSTNGLINIVAASGVKIHDMAIESASGNTGGSMVSVTSTSSFASSGITLENLWLSTFGSDTQVYSLYFDGSSKTSAPAGVRDVSLKNVHVFGSTNYSAFLKSIIGFSWIGGGVYPAGGTGPLSGAISISGVTSVKSQYVNISIVTCNGINLTNCLNVGIVSAVIGAISGVSINNDATCSLTSITGSLSGTLTANWLTSFCNDIGNKMSFDGGKVRITNASGGTTATNYLELAGATANNSNFPGIQFTGGTSPTTYASIVTNNSGQGMTIRNGSAAGVPNYQQMFMFTNSTAASSYTDFANAGTSTMRLLGDGKLGIGTTSPTAFVDIAASVTANASLRLRSGVAPTTPNDGDIWFDGSNLKIRISGVTKTFTVT